MSDSEMDNALDGDEGQQTRWWAIIAGLAATAALAWFMINFYQNRIPQDAFDNGVLAIQQGDWGTVRRSITSLNGNDKFASHRCYLQAAVEIDQGSLDTATRLLAKAGEHPDVRPYALVLAGVVDFRQGNFESAKENLAAAKELAPDLNEVANLEEALKAADDPMTRVGRALLAIGEGNIKGTETELQALKDLPNDAGEPYADFVAGVVQMRLNKYEEALTFFDGSRHHPDLKAQTLTLSGEALFHLGNYPAAIELFYQALDFDPEHVDAHRWLAQWFYDQGGLDFAAAHLTRITQLDKTDYRPYRTLGLMHLDFKNFEDAIENYDAALKLDPPQLLRAEILLEKAQALTQLRQFAAAIETLDDELVESITEPTYRDKVDLVLAECYLDGSETVDPTKANELITQLLERNSQNVEALILKGTLEQLNEAAPQAVATLEQATRLDPYNYTAHYKLAQAYLAAGDRAAAEATQQKYEKLKSLWETFSKLHEQASADLTDASLRYKLGTTALELGRPDLAFSWFRATLQLDPNHANANAQIQSLLANPALNGAAPNAVPNPGLPPGQQPQ